MKWRGGVALVFLCVQWLLLSACGAPQEPVKGLSSDVFRGAWFAKNDAKAILGDHAKESLMELKRLGVTWLALGPEVHMEDINRPALSYGKDDEDYRTFIRYCRSIGLSVVLLPRIESPSFFEPPFPFRADLQMLTSDHWETFHNNYEKMLVHYAKLAEEEGVGLFLMGLEYLTYVKRFPDVWRRFAKAVREVYKGKISYSANWYEEFEAIKFWDALDYIGVGAYFELTKAANPTVAQLKQSWQPIVQKLAALSKQYQKPVIFTEVGYTSFADAAAFPWKWQDDLDRAIAPQHQADCYDALFQVFSGQPWFKGFFVWRFYSTPSLAPTYGYSPIGKPSADVIQQWYLSTMD